MTYGARLLECHPEAIAEGSHLIAMRMLTLRFAQHNGPRIYHRARRNNMAQGRAQIEKAGAVHRPYPGTEEMAKRGNVEVKFSGPDGVTIDLSEHGWLGTK